jgi:hypothetical protein
LVLDDPGPGEWALATCRARPGVDPAALSIIDVMMSNSVDEIRGMSTTFGCFGLPRRWAHAEARVWRH